MLAKERFLAVSGTLNESRLGIFIASTIRGHVKAMGIGIAELVH